MLNGEILGLPIPDAGPVFAAALAIHIVGITLIWLALQRFHHRRAEGSR